MTRAVHRAGFRPLVIASRQLLLRPAALNIAAIMMLMLLALGLYSLSRGSFPLPASTLARALLAPQDMGEQPRFILFDIRLPRILMALLCGAMLGMAGAAMQSITRNGLADPGLIGVKEGASIVVLALVLFFPGGRPGLAAAGGNGRRRGGGLAGPDAGARLFAAALYFNWHRRLLDSGGSGRHLYDHRRRSRRADGDDLAGGQPAGRDLAAAGGGLLLGAARGHHPVLYRPGGGRGAAGPTGPPSASAYVCSS
ncbi:permease of ferrichrome ABC transporter [Klebsiella variicola]|nr:permease of ferrichrome ABC transporter [Klebsiella variicola]